jgi:hypothetical protein
VEHWDDNFVEDKHTAEVLKIFRLLEHGMHDQNTLLHDQQKH